MRLTKSTEKERAIMHGMSFIYRIARNAQNFADYGSDLLSCLYFIASTSKDAELRRTAHRMGTERARRWRSNHRSLPRRADADTILFFIHGSDTADRLGFPDERLKEQIRETAQKHRVQDYLYFNPAHEPPPTNVPYECDCGHANERGRKMCRGCKKRLTIMSRYLVWYEALMATYASTRYGVTLGADYSDVLKWLPTMRPYRGSENDSNPDFYDTVYAVTHVVYTLNDYSVYRLSPRWLPQEYEFLKASLKDALAMDDPEMTGEILDSLKAFGLTDLHPLIRSGTDYLLSKQNPDGSWGDMETEDIYARYHPTWTAIDGLREYWWRGTGLSFPKLKPLLKQMQGNRK